MVPWVPAALEGTYPETRQQRCWMHKTGHVLNTLSKSLQPKAKQMVHDIWQADTQDNAEKALELFVKAYEPKYPKATLYLQKDREELLAFYDFLAQHWQGLRTTILLNRRLSPSATARSAPRAVCPEMVAAYAVQAQPMC